MLVMLAIELTFVIAFRICVQHIILTLHVSFGVPQMVCDHLQYLSLLCVDAI